MPRIIYEDLNDMWRDEAFLAEADSRRIDVEDHETGVQEKAMLLHEYFGLHALRTGPGRKGLDSHDSIFSCPPNIIGGTFESYYKQVRDRLREYAEI